jgi:Rrf2 family transcriptional regulator, cysteine metabolism repressor
MKLSLSSEYALLTMIQLTRQAESLSVVEISAQQQIPPEPLAEIMAVLRQHGYVEQVTGRFHLAKSAGQISVAEIIRVFDGALAPLEPVSSKGYSPAPMDNEAKLSGLFENIQEQISTRLENTMLAEMA